MNLKCGLSKLLDIPIKYLLVLKISSGETTKMPLWEDSEKLIN